MIRNIYADIGICQEPSQTGCYTRSHARQTSRHCRGRWIPPVELRLPQLPGPASRNLPRQNPNPDSGRNQRRRALVVPAGRVSRPTSANRGHAGTAPSRWTPPVAHRGSRSRQCRHRPRTRPAAAAGIATPERIRYRFHPPHSSRRQFDVRHAESHSRSADLDRLRSRKAVPVAGCRWKRFWIALPRAFASALTIRHTFRHNANPNSTLEKRPWD